MNELALGTRPSHLASVRETNLVISFFALYRTARLVAADNKTYTDKRDEFCSRLHGTIETDGHCTIKAFQDRYFVNEKMVRLSRDQVASAGAILEEWQTLGIGGIRFAAGVTVAEVDVLIDTLTAERALDDNRDTVSARLQSLGLVGISLLAAHEVQEEEDDLIARRQQLRRMARASFFRAMESVKQLVTTAADEGDTNVARTKRVVHSLIDLLLQDESSLLELTAIRDFDDYTYAHSTNVSIYSLTIGVRLGLDRARLSELGFAALFHDIGKVRLPRDLIAKPDAFDENDWAQMQRHPVLGAKSILRNMAFSVHAARAARGAFEHHINRDYTGYPVLRHQKREPNLFSQIIAVADTFDALTSGRVYIKKHIPPDEVIRKMRYQMTTKFDPLLLKLFMDIVGIYPAGSLVLLSSRELALVLTQNQADQARPYVKIVGNRKGLFKQSQWVDLADPAQAHRKIVRLVEPEKYGLNLQRFILRD